MTSDEVREIFEQRYLQDGRFRELTDSLTQAIICRTDLANQFTLQEIRHAFALYLMRRAAVHHSIDQPHEEKGN